MPAPTTLTIEWSDIHFNGQMQGRAGQRLFTVWGDELDDWFFTVEVPDCEPQTFGEFESDILAARGAERWQTNHPDSGDPV